MSAAQAQDKAPLPPSFIKDHTSNLCSSVLTTLQLLFVAIVLLVCVVIAVLDALKPLERLKSFVLFLEDTIVAFGDKSYEAVKRFNAASHDDTTEAFENKAFEALKRGFKVAVHDIPYVSYYLLVAAQCLDFGGVRRFLFVMAFTCCALGLLTETSVRAWFKDNGVTHLLKGIDEVPVEDASAGRFKSFLLFLDTTIEAFEDIAYEALKRVWMSAVHDAPNLSICLLSAVLCRHSGRGLLYFLLLTVVSCCIMGHFREVDRKSTEDTSTDDDDDGNDEESSEVGKIDDDSDDNTDGDDKESSEVGRIDDGNDDDTDCDDDGDNDYDGDDDEAHIENKSTLDADINSISSEEQWHMI